MEDIMNTNYMDIQIQIQQEVPQTDTSDGCYGLGSSMISWFSKKQPSVSLSTSEAKHLASCSACCEAIWIWKMMSGLFDMDLDTKLILCDN